LHSSCSTEAAVKKVRRQTTEKWSKNKKHSAPFSRIFTRVFEATMDKMDNLIDHLKKLPSSKYHVHETEACRMLEIKAADGGASSCSQPSELTSALKRAMLVA
jgi:hypothetical protein